MVTNERESRGSEGRAAAYQSPKTTEKQVVGTIYIKKSSELSKAKTLAVTIEAK